jgi:hypothetical protein
MKKYVIEREIPGVGGFKSHELRGAAETSNTALKKLAPKVQWVTSYVARDKTFCIYIAESEADVTAHAQLSGFPANRITEVTGVIDPTTAGTS